MAWQTARGYCWARARRMLGERLGATFAGTIVLAVALALPGCIFMLVQSLAPVIGRLPVAEATAFVAAGAGAGDVKALAGRLEAIDGVGRVRLVAREQAWAELQRRNRDTQALADIKPNPLPDALVVEFLPRLAAARVEAAVAAIAKQPRVEAVQVDLEWYRRVVGILQMVWWLLLGAGAVGALLVIVTTVALVGVVAMVAPVELRLLEQIGAEADFVRRPFVYAGATLLGLGAAGALGLVALARAVANPPLAELGRTFGLELGLQYPPWPLVLAFVAACLLIGASAGNFFAGKQIKLARA